MTIRSASSSTASPVRHIESAPAASAAAALATTASSVWARWRTTSATDHPAAADGLNHVLVELVEDRLEPVLLGHEVVKDLHGRTVTRARAEWSRGVGWGAVGLVGDEGMESLAGEVVELSALAGGFDDVGGLAAVEVGFAVVGFDSRLPLASAVIPPSVYARRWSTSQWVIGASQPEGCWQWRSRTWMARRSIPRKVRWGEAAMTLSAPSKMNVCTWDRSRWGTTRPG